MSLAYNRALANERKQFRKLKFIVEKSCSTSLQFKSRLCNGVCCPKRDQHCGRLILDGLLEVQEEIILSHNLTKKSHCVPVTTLLDVMRIGIEVDSDFVEIVCDRPKK